MDDSGAPISYEVLRTGTSVYSSDQTEIGRVTHVLADTGSDIFDGIVIGHLSDAMHGAGRGAHRFVDAPEVAAIHERAVLLSIDLEACRALHEPTANPGELTVDPADSAPGIGGKLRRAWDLLSGNY